MDPLTSKDIVQCLLCFGEFVTPQIPPYDTRKIEQYVDHFGNYQTKETFLEKYLITGACFNWKPSP